MGVRDIATLRRASDLGLALQLTNIARGVIEDAKVGRLYQRQENHVIRKATIGADALSPGR
jgi:15-cis-phytoene synthase